MITINVNLPEVRNYFKEIQKKPGEVLNLIRCELPQRFGRYINRLMDVEIELFLGRKRYERNRGRRKALNYRNGHRDREFTVKGIGSLSLSIPRDRKGEYKTGIIPRYKRYEDTIKEDLSLLFLGGLSTRNVSLISKRLIGRKFSKSEVSEANKELIEAIEAWRTRDLSQIHIKYMYLDGVLFRMRCGKKVEKVPVLVCIGVDKEGYKQVLSMQSGDKESAGAWREFFKDLKRRGLDGSDGKLGIMDGLPGLEKVFEEEFLNSDIQRCQVHVARNVLAKVPKSLKKAVADDIRSIFYASSYEKAKKFFEEFKRKWSETVPSAVKCLENSIEKCLTFYKFPAEEWICLRTTNVIERLNKEFKRRTKTMEILAGEKSCYLLLSFIAFKMELGWRNAPLSSTHKKLGLSSKFTQNS